MIKLFVLLLLVSCVFTKKAEILSEKCKKLFELHSDNVHFCCDIIKHDSGSCQLVCRDENDDNCSCANCLKENYRVPRLKDQFLDIYNRHINERKTSGEEDNWLPVLSKSFEHCKPLLNVLNGTDECQLPNYYRPMVSCMSQQNFFNCPQSSIALSEKCEATRKFLKEQKTCGTKYEDIFVIDDSIFNQYSYQFDKCQQKFEGANLKTSESVDVPKLSPPSDVHNSCVLQCFKKCTKENCLVSSCCITPCLLNATSFEDFGKEVVKDKIIEFIKFNCKASAIDFDIWKPVIESSFGICYPLASSVIGTKMCNILMKYLSLVSCMRQQLFYNAPTSLIKNADQYENIKRFIADETKCGQKIGEKFIIDGSFWFY